MTQSEAAKEKRRQYQREWHLRNKEKQNQRSREWAKKNPERHVENVLRWERENPEKRAQKQRSRYRRKSKEPLFRLRLNLSRAMRNSLGRSKAGRGWEEMVGYTREELAAHLERQFLRGMTWENMGDWHIDHIVPLASFTITGPDDPEFRRAWSLANIRPLWAAENLRKGCKVETLL